MEKKYNTEEKEREILEFWDTAQVFKFSGNSDKEVFSIDTPPPTVSGALHIGHVFSYTHADLLARYKRMCGKDVFYPMGFDDNGLPTEKFVEKKHKIRAHQMKRSEFITLCLKECGLAEKEFEKLWKSLGLSIDWTHTFSTISEKARKTAQYSFIKLYKDGLIERKAEPSLYCTTCGTTVAQAELESQDVSTTFNTIEFKAHNGNPILIATTRPELLPACVAVFYHPSDERYKHLQGTAAKTPIFEKEVPVLADSDVDPEKGTGIVMCCTFGDQADIIWYKRHKLPFVQAIDKFGKWTNETGPLEGLRVKAAREKIIELLKEQGKLHKQESLTHAVNVHERCRREIEYLILMQWFVRILHQKQKFLELAEEIEWSPKFMKSRYIDWVKNLAWDWCISRQRFYGIPFPVWHCKDCGEVILQDISKLPTDPQEENCKSKKCLKCDSENIAPDTDIMDTWFTSALTPQINAGWPEKEIVNLPMDMRPQAHDIIRTWAFYTIVKSFYHNKTIPWKKAVISGHVLSGKEKLSKSGKSSKLTPENLLGSYSADAVRYWAAGGRLGMDTAFSEMQLKTGQRLVTKLWNAFRFCSEHLKDYTPPK
ncbi:valine--tRNA ligase, partial [Candidatus Dependentiae bacterium]